MLPFFGPSTLRDGVGLAVDAQARPQKYIMDDQDGLYWSIIYYKPLIHALNI